MIEKYSAPVAQLLTVGMPEDQWRKPADYVQLYGLTAEHLPELLVLMKDESLYEIGEPENYAPIHGHRAAAQLGGLTVFPALLELLLDPAEEENEFLQDDMVVFFAQCGPTILPELQKALKRHQSHVLVYGCLMDTIVKMTQVHPSTHHECVQIFIHLMQKYKKQDDVFNGFLLSGLLKLKAVEAISIIRQAFAFDKIDSSFKAYRSGMGA